MLGCQGHSYGFTVLEAGPVCEGCAPQTTKAETQWCPKRPLIHIWQGV